MKTKTPLKSNRAVIVIIGAFALVAVAAIALTLVAKSKGISGIASALNPASYNAAGKITVARAEALKTANSEYEQMSATVAGQTGTKIIASSKADVCYLDHDDTGFAITNWNQTCYIRYVIGVATDRAVNTSQAQPNCAISEFQGHWSGFYRPARSTNGAYYEPCAVPDPFISTNVVAYARDGLATKAYSTYRRNDIDSAQNQIWMIYEDQYYHEKLGCGIGIDCPSPRKQPVHPN